MTVYSIIDHDPGRIDIIDHCFLQMAGLGVTMSVCHSLTHLPDHHQNTLES